VAERKKDVRRKGWRRKKKENHFETARLLFFPFKTINFLRTNFSVGPFVSLTICVFVCLSICPFVHLSIWPFDHLSVYLSVHDQFHWTNYLSFEFWLNMFFLLFWNWNHYFSSICNCFWFEKNVFNAKKGFKLTFNK